MFTVFLATQLMKRGIYVMPIAFPAVKQGEASLRFFLSSAQTEGNCRTAIDAIIEEIPHVRQILEKYKAEHPQTAGE